MFNVGKRKKMNESKKLAGEDWLEEYMKLEKPTKEELEIASKCLKKLIYLARFDLEHAKDQVYYGKRYKVLYDAESVVNYWRSNYVTQ